MASVVVNDWLHLDLAALDAAQIGDETAIGQEDGSVRLFMIGNAIEQVPDAAYRKSRLLCVTSVDQRDVPSRDRNRLNR